MDNDEKGAKYHQLLLQHDKLDGQIADIKSEAGGMTMNDEQQAKIDVLEEQKFNLVTSAQRLFEV